MLELTMMLLGVTLAVYILRVIVHRDELNFLSIIVSVITISKVLEDGELGNDLIIYIVPLLYMILMSALSIAYPEGRK